MKVACESKKSGGNSGTTHLSGMTAISDMSDIIGISSVSRMGASVEASLIRLLQLSLLLLPSSVYSLDPLSPSSISIGSSARHPGPS